jgi:hypothetical protein
MSFSQKLLMKFFTAAVIVAVLGVIGQKLGIL